MNYKKRILSTLLALALMLGVSLPIWAAQEDQAPDSSQGEDTSDTGNDKDDVNSGTETSRTPTVNDYIGAGKGSLWFQIEVTAGEGGAISPSGTVAVFRGQEKTFLIKPKAGYSVLNVTVDGISLGSLTRYEFQDVMDFHTISATFIKMPENGGHPCPSTEFHDVPADAWYHSGVDQALIRGIMAGVSDTQFQPDGEVTRAMVAQLLYNQANKPAVTTKPHFPDVEPNSWYEKAVCWASEQGLFSGYKDGTFRPDTLISRQELVMLLYKQAGSPRIMADDQTRMIAAYSDGTHVEKWAATAVAWGIRYKLLDLTNTGALNPTGSPTRAEAAVMLVQAQDKRN